MADNADNGHEQEEESDANMVNVRILNEAGNDQFNAGNWELARQNYTEALECDTSNIDAVVYANRCAVFIKENNYELALQDAKKAVEIAPEWWKGYFRMGQVYNLMQVHQESLKYFKLARDMNPSRQDLTDAVNDMERKIQKLEIAKIRQSLETIPEHPAESIPEESFVHRMEVVQYLLDNHSMQPNTSLLEIKKRAEHSQYFQQFLIAEHHFCEAIYMLMKLTDMERLPFVLCEKFITEFAAGLKMEMSTIHMPLDLANRACYILKQVLSLGTTFHEDACICYVSLEVNSWLAVMQFLGNCIRRYPSNPFFLNKRAKMLPSNLCYNEALQDINDALRLDPSKHQYWYCRAEIMQELYPKVSVEAAIDAFEEFLRRSPADDHHVAFAHYHISTLCTKMAASNVALAHPAMHKHYHEAAQRNRVLFDAAEERQLPVMYQAVRKQFFEYFV